MVDSERNLASVAGDATRVGFPGFNIGSIRVDPPLALAPMEDVTSIPFRALVKRIGAPGLMFSEFISAMAVHYNAAKTLKKFQVRDAERPVGIQIFGSDVATMAECARLAEELGADIVDINMGCWVPKVCKTGSGAALLKDPDLAEAIVRGVVAAVNVPVTVKVRAGWDYALYAAPELGRRFEAAGAAAMTLHARFAKQGFDGAADWKLIEDLRRAITIPLMGNGDVKTPDDAVRLLRESGADGVMVGRAAISNPWSIAAISARLQGLPEPQAPTIQARLEAGLELLRGTIAYEANVATHDEALALGEEAYAQAERFAVRRLRGQLPLFVKGATGAAQLRNRVTQCDHLATVEDAFRDFSQRLSDSALAATDA